MCGQICKCTLLDGKSKCFFFQEVEIRTMYRYIVWRFVCKPQVDVQSTYPQSVVSPSICNFDQTIICIPAVVPAATEIFCAPSEIPIFFYTFTIPITHTLIEPQWHNPSLTCMNGLQYNHYYNTAMAPYRPVYISNTYSTDSWCEVLPTIFHKRPRLISNHVLYMIILTICTFGKQVLFVQMYGLTHFVSQILKFRKLHSNTMSHLNDGIFCLVMTVNN